MSAANAAQERVRARAKADPRMGCSFLFGHRRFAEAFLRFCEASLTGKYFRDRTARLDDLQRPADVALVLLARVDLQRRTERAEQVRHRHRPLDHLHAPLVRGTDDAAAPDAGAG